MNNLNKDFYIFKKISLVDRFNFYEYLSVMLDGGLTIIDGLKSVESKIKNLYFKEKINELIIYVSSGDSLSKSMKKMPDAFSQSEISIIEAGEFSGTLVDSLNNLSNEYRKLHDLRLTIKSSLTYPVIIFIFLVIAVMVVMTYVVPSIIPLIEEAGVEKPFSTVALIATSNFISNNILLIITFFLFLVLLFQIFRNSQSGKIYIDTVLLKIPLVGNVYKNYLLALISSTFGTLMNAGIPVVKSLILVGKATNNIVYEEMFNEISSKVAKGVKVVESIESSDKNDYFPLDFLQLLSVGERTASINKVCQKLNSQYIREVNYSLGNLTKWVEPIAIFVAGLFVLWFAFAIFGSILKLTQTIG